MVAYDNLRAVIAANVYANNNNEVTADMVKAAMEAMVASLGAEYQFGGVVDLSTPDPGTPDYKVAYLAATPGTYSNFGGITLADGEVAILKWNGSWSKETTGIATAAALGAAIAAMAQIVNTMPDFAISDPVGYNIVEFRDGHIKTKNFDSASAPRIGEITGADFSISDAAGNEIARLFNGHVRTKNFDSSKMRAARYSGKKISVLGDSISSFGAPDSRNENGTYCYSYYPLQSCRYSESGDVVDGGTTYDSIKFNVLNTWWMRLLNKLGATLGINDSFRGQTISNKRGAQYSLSNQTRIDHLGQNGAPDVILVYGGTNDAGADAEIGTFDTTPPPTTAEGIAALGSDTFADGVRTMLVRLLYTYRNSEIVVILPTLTTSYYTIENLDLYVEVLRTACDYFGVRYVDLRTAGITYYNKNMYFIDGIHPNEKGMALLCDCIYKSLIF